MERSESQEVEVLGELSAKLDKKVVVSVDETDLEECAEAICETVSDCIEALWNISEAVPGMVVMMFSEN